MEERLPGSLRRLVRERERALAELADEHRALELEQAKSERLLLNVLPARVAECLKEHEGILAEDCPDVTVLFRSRAAGSWWMMDLKNPQQ